MKTEIKYILLMLLSCFYFTISIAQDLKQFTVKKNDGFSSYSVNPNFVTPPAEYLSYNLTSKTSGDYSWSGFQKIFPVLFNKVESLLEGKEILFVNFYFNEKGEIVYLYFTTFGDILPKLTDELLLDIYNTLKTVKIENIEKMNKNSDIGNKIGMLRFYFRSKNR